MAVDKVKQAFLDIDAAIKIVNTEAVALTGNLKTINETLSSNKGLSTLVTNINALNKAQQESAAITKTQQELSKKEAQLRAAVSTALHKEETLRQAKNRTVQQEITTANKQVAASKKQAAQQQKLVTEIAKTTSAYAKLTAKSTLAAQKAREIGAAQGVTSKAFKQASASALKYNTQLQKINSKMGSYQMNVGNYASGLGKLTSAFGVVGGVALFAKTVKAAYDISTKFEKQNAVLASVLGKTRSETGLLQSESKRLGASTAFSATQVVELQTELARLGKSETEIKASTEGIINATIALGSETGETAALVGATLNAFQLSASKSGKVADVLTLATQKSALSFEKLHTALPIVSGTAAAAGVSLEEMTAQLGNAADRGIDASTAASALRNIYIELKTSGLTMNEALEKINTSTNKVKTAFDLFGKKGISTALALAGTTAKTNKLTKALEGAGGTAERVANEQLDTIDGKTKLLNSAFEGLVLNIFDTDGAFGAFTTTLLVLVTALINGVNSLFDVSVALTDVQIATERVADTYATERAMLDDSEVARQKLIESLESEGLGYDSAKEAAQEYLDTLKFFDEGGTTKLNITFLEAEIEMLEKSGIASDALFQKKEKLKTLQDELKFASIKLKEATDEELNGYLSIQDQLLPLNDAEKQFVDSVLAEIDARNNLTNGIDDEIDGNVSLIKIQQDLLAEAKKMSEATENDLAIKQTKIDLINEEISRLKALRETQGGDIESVAMESKGVDAETIDSIGLKQEEIDALAVLDQEGLDESLERQQAAADNIVAIEQQKQDQLTALRDAGFEAAATTIDELFTRYSDSLWDEVDAKNEADEERLDDDELSAEQQEAIQEDIDKKSAARKTAAAKKEKKANLIQAAINTALSITKVIATTPFPAAIPFIIAAGAIGAVNSALIASQPIPQYDKGTKSLPSLSEVAEKRPEFVKNKGRVELFTSPTVLGKDYKGAEVISGAETSAMLENATRTDALINAKQDVQIMADFATKKLESQVSALISEVKKNRQNNRDYGKELRAMKMGDYVKKHSK